MPAPPRGDLTAGGGGGEGGKRGAPAYKWPESGGSNMSGYAARWSSIVSEPSREISGAHDVARSPSSDGNDESMEETPCSAHILWQRRQWEVE